MRIILLASREQKDEMLEQTGNMPADVVWLTDPRGLSITEQADACIDLFFDGSLERIQSLKALKVPLIIVNSVVHPLNDLTSEWVRINGWSTFLKRELVEASGEGQREKAEAVFSVFNKELDWVADITGFISARVVVAVINEAWFALGEKLSTRDDIDTAMKLGTNYPFGPFEWSEKIGLKNIYALLQSLSVEQSRYQPAPLLTKEANI
jgi:3-hydroxybutyryl-CoA dehydrogenase